MMLNLFLALPVVSAFAVFLMRGKGARAFASFVVLTQIVLALFLTCGKGDPGNLVVFTPWAPDLGLNWSLQIDGLNLLLVLLTPILTFLALRATDPKTKNLHSFAACLLLLDGFLCGLFLAQNLGLFYIFFEAMLLPTLILVAGWAKKDGPATALKFLMFTLLGSLPMLLGILVLAFSGIGGDSLEFADLGGISASRQLYLFFPFLLAFLIKMPMVPLHGWLPTLYRNAPASVTVIIAAIMSKAGAYGLLKVGLTVFPDAFRQLSGSIALLAVISILYGALAALGSDSLKEVLAFSSLSHMGMIAFGMTSFTLVGDAGAGLQMAGHALATGGLFLALALMEKRNLPDQLRRYGGLAKHAPRLAALTLFLTLAALGQPGLGSFPGELMILIGTWERYPVLTLLAVVSIALAAAYMLRWYQTIFTGTEGTYQTPTDLSGSEVLILAAPVTMSLLLGFFPALFLSALQLWLEGVL